MNCRRTVIYTGVTNDLSRRIWEHKNPTDPECFTAKYNVDELVYYEIYENIYEAINREKQIKGWRRSKKIWLIKTLNSELKELSLNN